MGMLRRLLPVGVRMVTLLHKSLPLRRTHMPHPLTVRPRGHTALLHHMGTVPRLPTIMATMVLHRDTATALLLVTVRVPVCLYYI